MSSFSMEAIHVMLIIPKETQRGHNHTLQRSDWTHDSLWCLICSQIPQGRWPCLSCSLECTWELSKQGRPSHFISDVTEVQEDLWAHRCEREGWKLVCLPPGPRALLQSTLMGTPTQQIQRQCIQRLGPSTGKLQGTFLPVFCFPTGLWLQAQGPAHENTYREEKTLDSACLWSLHALLTSLPLSFPFLVVPGAVLAAGCDHNEMDFVQKSHRDRILTEQRHQKWGQLEKASPKATEISKPCPGYDKMLNLKKKRL